MNKIASTVVPAAVEVFDEVTHQITRPFVHVIDRLDEQFAPISRGISRQHRKNAFPDLIDMSIAGTLGVIIVGTEVAANHVSDKPKTTLNTALRVGLHAVALGTAGYVGVHTVDNAKRRGLRS